MIIAISSGHGLHVAGARDIIDEVTEARRVTNRVAEILHSSGNDVLVFHDDTTRPPNSTVNTQNNWHNRQNRDLDVQVHFNAVAGTRDAGIGVETLYKTGNMSMREIAGRVSKAITDASGLILRHQWRDVPGTVARNDLGFLNRTNLDRAVLLEVCFVNSRTDVRLYQQYFEEICHGIAEALIGRTISAPKKLKEDKPGESWPISEGNLEAMQALGVMNSPDYWRTVTSIEWLDQLLTNAAVAGRLDARIDNGITDVGAALETLIDARIISTPDYWKAMLRPENTVPWLDHLLMNIANRSRDILERIIWAEARGEDLEGQVLVGNVIMNRSNSPAFQSGIRNVVFANGTNSQGVRTYQFSPIANGAYAKAIPTDAQRRAVDQVLDGVDHSRGATFFRTIQGMSGSWHEQALEHLFNHGRHAFFRERPR